MNLRGLLVGAAALLAMVPAARATPIMYTLDATGFGETLAGTFTFNNSVPSLLSVDLALTGSGLLSAVFTVPGTTGFGFAGCTVTIGSNEANVGAAGSCFTAANSSDSEQLTIAFSDLLSTTPDPAAIFGVVTAEVTGIDDLTGSADPVPEPASISLLAPALLGLGFLARRKRNAS